MKKTTFLLNALLCFLLSITTSNTIAAQTLEIYADEQADIEARIEHALLLHDKYENYIHSSKTNR